MSGALDKIINIGILAGLSVIGYYYWRCAQKLGTYSPGAVLPCILFTSAEDVAETAVKEVGSGVKHLDDKFKQASGGVSFACISTGSVSRECAEQYKRALCNNFGICL